MAERSVIQKINGELIKELTTLRMYIESAIDFPEEEIDFLKETKIFSKINDLIERVEKIKKEAHCGILMSEGIKVVIMGRPNAGKSSLLNVLLGEDRAIVTPIPGTTRDILRETISIDGLLVELVDTAGLRAEADIIEQEGIRRALQEIVLADHLVLVVDKSETLETNPSLLFPEWIHEIPTTLKITVLTNKIDKLNLEPDRIETDDYTVIGVSAKTKAGIDIFKEHLKKVVGFEIPRQGHFMARRRHLEALTRALAHLEAGKTEWQSSHSIELLAEELRLAQLQLGQITGRVSSDDLLGKIFSEFCIGK